MTTRPLHTATRAGRRRPLALRPLAAALLCWAGAACAHPTPAPPVPSPFGDTAAVEVTRGSIARRAARASAVPEFWAAVAAVDCDAADRGARTFDERMFAIAFRALTDGRHEEAVVAFRALLDAEDPTVRAAARTGRTLALEGQGRWRELAADLQRETAPVARDPASIELWARAFAALPPATYRVPFTHERLPLQRSASGTPIVAVRVNGSVRHFWLDTGASLTMLAADVARDLGVEPLGDDTLAIATWAGRVPARPAMVSQFQLGGVEVARLPVAVLDESVLRFDHREERRDGRAVPISVRLDGVIGTDLLRRLDLTLDVPNGALTIARPVARPRGARARNVYWLGFPVLRLTTASGGTALVGLDTGADSSFVTESWFLVDSTGRVRQRRGEIVGLGATSMTTTQAVHEVVVSDESYTVRLRNVSIAPERHATYVTLDGVFGSDFIRYAEVRLDMSNGIFSVKPARRRR